MPTDAELAQELYLQLKPFGLRKSREYIMARTPAALQDDMPAVIDADFAAMTGGVPEAPADGKLYVRQNSQWVEDPSVGEPVVVSCGAVSGTAILTTPTAFAVHPPEPNLGGYWNSDTQTFAPPPGAYQINAALACVSTNNSADATLMLMLNGIEFAQVTAGAAMGNLMSCTLGLALVTNPGDVLTFTMLADRADMTVRTPGSGLSIIGRSFTSGPLTSGA